VKATRLRPAYSPEDLERLYARPYDSSHSADHDIRVEMTIAFGRAVTAGLVETAADLSCGNGRIVRGIVPDAILGDFAPGYPITGRLEETLPKLDEVDLYVCCETLEHLDDPLPILKTARDRARFLLVTTPVDMWQDRELEHYWAWDRDYVEDMMKRAAWIPAAYNMLDLGAVSFGMWVCR
jgi:hypothetical protein